MGGEIGEDLMKPAKEEPRAGCTDGGKGEREKERTDVLRRARDEAVRLWESRSYFGAV